LKDAEYYDYDANDRGALIRTCDSVRGPPPEKAANLDDNTGMFVDYNFSL
jgi:hypothetical protein